ncbi:hypothetical protein FPV67DRAFT_1778829 [Lyophyllum atratum]|nr:hypothetical protein FPV67DRAFT_1778829 [Lyophyllum atratum]
MSLQISRIFLHAVHLSDEVACTFFDPSPLPPPRSQHAVPDAFAISTHVTDATITADKLEADTVSSNVDDQTSPDRLKLQTPSQRTSTHISNIEMLRVLQLRFPKIAGRSPAKVIPAATGPLLNVVSESKLLPALPKSSRVNGGNTPKVSKWRALNDVKNLLSSPPKTGSAAATISPILSLAVHPTTFTSSVNAASFWTTPREADGNLFIKSEDSAKAMVIDGSEYSSSLTASTEDHLVNLFRSFHASEAAQMQAASSLLPALAVPPNPTLIITPSDAAAATAAAADPRDTQGSSSDTTHIWEQRWWDWDTWKSRWADLDSPDSIVGRLMRESGAKSSEAAGEEPGWADGDAWKSSWAYEDPNSAMNRWIHIRKARFAEGCAVEDEVKTKTEGADEEKVDVATTNGATTTVASPAKSEATAKVVAPTSPAHSLPIDMAIDVVSAGEPMDIDVLPPGEPMNIDDPAIYYLPAELHTDVDVDMDVDIVMVDTFVFVEVTKAKRSKKAAKAARPSRQRSPRGFYGLKQHLDPLVEAQIAAEVRAEKRDGAKEERRRSKERRHQRERRRAELWKDLEMNDSA